jgi:hypothetical protein
MPALKLGLSGMDVKNMCEYVLRKSRNMVCPQVADGGHEVIADSRHVGALQSQVGAYKRSPQKQQVLQSFPQELEQALVISVMNPRIQ